MSHLMEGNGSLATCFMVLKDLILLAVRLLRSPLNLFGARWFSVEYRIDAW